jgi:hypothetical protein
MTKSIKHFVITRLGLGIEDEAWYQRKIPLFKQFCLQSLLAQTDPDFYWFIAMDSKAPAWVREEIKSAVSGNTERIQVATIDMAAVSRCVLGGYQWVFDEVAKSVGLPDLIDDPGEFIITSQIDDDDAWHVVTNERVKAIALSELDSIIEEEKMRPYLVYPSHGLLINFVNGLNFYMANSSYKKVTRPYHSMSIFVLTRFLSGITACSSRHRSWEHFKEVVRFRHISEETPVPMWLYNRHPDAIDGNVVAPEGCRSVDGDILNNFGLDIEAIKKLSETMTSEWSQDVGASAKMRLRDHYYHAAQNYLNTIKRDN